MVRAAHWMVLVAWVWSVAGVVRGQEPGGRDLPSRETWQSASMMYSQRFSNGGGREGNGGGASLANYTELMNLIENVIDAPWMNNGGTATMSPFRSGVRIDPEGLIERLEQVERVDALRMQVDERRSDRLKPTIRLDQMGDWQRGASLRWVSLHELDEQLAHRWRDGQSASIAMELLGGLCRIDYVAFDASSGEWLLGGPAGKIAANAQGDLLHEELRLPPILLEDLLTVAPHVLNERGELGCSIDPVQERLVAAYKMARSPASIRDLRSDPDHWAQEWKSTLGRQRATVIGVPEDSPTGYALLIADAHMKRVALGLEAAPEGLKNYWLEADMIAQERKGGMVRWWFTLSDAPIAWDHQRRIAHFAESNVRVLSETQMIDVQGKRVVAQQPDWAADAYARNFTNKFDALQRSYAIYGRLRHVFDLAVALEIVRSQIQSGHGKPLKCLSRMDLQPHMPVAPREIDSVVATRRLSDGNVSAIVSGGVSIVPRSIASRIRRSDGGLESVVVERSPGERDSDGEGDDKPFWR